MKYSTRVMENNFTLPYLKKLKVKHHNPIVIFRSNNLYQIIGEDAEWFIDQIGTLEFDYTNGFPCISYLYTEKKLTSKIIFLALNGVIFVDKIIPIESSQTTLF